MKRYVHTTIKMSLASIVAILIAELLRLDYAISGGILAVLSVQLTRKDSYIIAIKRLADAVIALLLSTAFFVIFGYTVWVFTFFIVAFIAVSFALKMPEGIVPSLVLVSHLLIHGSFDAMVIINGFLLMGIAIIVALGLNLFYPLNTELAMTKTKKEIDALIVVDLQLIASVLSAHETREKAFNAHKIIYEQLDSLLKEAALIDKDILFDKDRLAISYLKMREAQMVRLDRIFTLLNQIKSTHPNALLLGDYVEQLSRDIGEANKATSQLETLQALLNNYRETPLPKTREEFETRAVLFQMMFELESFLKQKIAFHQRYL